MEVYRYQCECGSNISGSSIYKHIRTQKHISRVASAHVLVQRGLEEIRLEARRQEEQKIEHNRRMEQQIKLLKHFEEIKKQEEVRVEKRGLPKHIAAMAYEHPSFEKSCMICMENMNLTNLFMSKCGHVMCKGCEHNMFQQQINKCPTCRSEF